MNSRLLVTFAVTGTIAGMALGQTATPGILLVLSKGEQMMSTVDPTTLKVVKRFPSGPDPHEVIASTDGRFAYISNYGGGAFNTIGVIDFDAEKALSPIDLGALRGPHGLVYVANKLWFTAEGSKVVGRYDPATKQIDLVLGTGQNRTHMIDVSADANRIVTTNISSATVTIFDRGAGGRGGQENWDATVVPVGRGAEGFDVSPDRKEIWVANAQDGTISILDAGAKKVTDTLPANVATANRLKFTPDGRLVFVSGLRMPEVAIFEAASRREVKRLAVGHGAAGIQMQPDGARAYVSCTPDNYVAVVELKSLEVVGRIEAGRQPDGLAWASRR